MANKRINLKEAIKFHGHLGPYLVLGLLAGKFALKELGCKKYFGLNVKVYGADEKPKSCLIDGLQLSTGATYGKANIQKYRAKKIMIMINNLKANRKFSLGLKENLIKKLDALKGHGDSEKFAKELIGISPGDIFTKIRSN